jgi:predicted choloylglycine hydrolase
LSNCSQVVGVDDDGPFLIRNYDFDPALNEATLLRSAWKGRPVIATLEGMAGAADGINAAGLAVSLTFGGRRNIGRGFGIPLIIRYLLEVCGSTVEAVEVLRRIPCHMSYNVTAVDRTGGFTTVYLSPDRPAIVTKERATTNHQLGVEWPAHASLTRTIQRKEHLGRLVAEGKLSAARASTAFLEPPLYSTHWEKGVGTVYTALYRPAQGTLSLLWPRQKPWRKSLRHFVQDTRFVTFLAEGQSVDEIPKYWVFGAHRVASTLALWDQYLPAGFGKALADNINDPTSADWQRLAMFWLGPSRRAKADKTTEPGGPEGRVSRV